MLPYGLGCVNRVGNIVVQVMMDKSDTSLFGYTELTMVKLRHWPELRYNDVVFKVTDICFSRRLGTGAISIIIRRTPSVMQYVTYPD